MELSTTFLLFIAAFGASALGGVLGMASGIFIVPILTMFFGIDFHVAIGASLISVIACSCGSASSYVSFSAVENAQNCRDQGLRYFEEASTARGRVLLYFIRSGFL